MNDCRGQSYVGAATLIQHESPQPVCGQYMLIANGKKHDEYC